MKSGLSSEKWLKMNIQRRIYQSDHQIVPPLVHNESKREAPPKKKKKNQREKINDYLAITHHTL